MTALRVLIVDDEPPARAKIARFLAGDARFAVAGEAGNGEEAIAAIERLRPDLLILDVQMPGLTGFDVVEALDAGSMPKIIFSTAYDQYAVRAFEAAALDYLLKPYDRARFQRALDKAHESLRSGDAGVLAQVVADWRTRSGAVLERLLVKDGETWTALPLERVTRLSAEDKYVRAFHDQGAQSLVRNTIKALEQQLDPRRFVRVHRGEIVALDAVVKLEPWSHGDGILVLRDGTSVILSRTHREAFLRRWGGG